MVNNFFIDCVCSVFLTLLECSVLAWMERSMLMSRACVGGLLLAKGVVSSLLATGTVLGSTASMFLRIRSDIQNKQFRLAFFRSRAGMDHGMSLK